MIVIEPVGDLGRIYRYGGRTVSRQASSAEIAKRRAAATQRRLRTRRLGIKTLTTKQRLAVISKAERSRAATARGTPTRRIVTRRKPARRVVRKTRYVRRATRSRARARSRTSPRAVALRARDAARRRTATARRTRARVYYTTSPNDAMIQQALREVMTATGLRGGEKITDIDALTRMVTARLQQLTQTTRKIARGAHIDKAIANVKITEPWESRADKMRPHVRETQERKLKKKFFQTKKPRRDLPASWAKMVEVSYGGQAMPYWNEYFSERLTIREVEDKVAADYVAGMERWEALRAEYHAAVDAWHEGGQVGPHPERGY